MPIRRKHQIAALLETSEGSDPWGAGVAPSASDVLTVYEPDVQDAVELNERQVAGASLSRGFDTVGTQTRTVTFRSDLVGNVTGATDDDRRNAVPPFDPLLRASGFERVSLVRVAGLVVSGPFYVGERIGSASWGAGTPANWGYAVNAGDGGELFVVPIAGDIGSATDVYGEQSGASIIGGTIDATGGVGYLPDSQKTILAGVGAWSSGAPTAGDILRILDGTTGELKGSAQAIVVGATMTLAVFYGSAEVGDDLETAAGSTAAISSVTAGASPSLGIFSNLDSLERRTLGARGDFSLSAEVGNVFEFSWTFNGSAVAPADSVQVSGVSLDTLQGPRFQGATLGIGYDRTGSGEYFDTCLPVKSVELAPGNSIENRRAPCSTTGLAGASLIDRDPTLSIDVEQVGVGAFDWIGALTNAKPIRFGFVIGTEVGNRVGIIIPNGQVTEVSDGEADGLAIHSVTIKARRVQEAGDDELAIFKF